MLGWWLTAGRCARPSRTPPSSRPHPCTALVSFGIKFETELAEIIGTRLVQTSHVQRALALRVGLSMIAPAVTGAVHLIEVGPGAGLNLRFDRYGYRIAGRRYGDPASPVPGGVPRRDPVARSAGPARRL